MIPCITGRISTVHGIITAIREEIEVGGRVVEVYASVCGNKSTYRRVISVCSAGTKKSRTIFAQLILYVIRLRVYLYVSD